MVYSLTPPKLVRGMTVLNRDAFTCNYEVPYLRLCTSIDKNIMKIVKNYILKLRQFKSVRTEGENLIVYLNPQKVETFDDIDEKDRDVLSQFTTKIEKTTLALNYSNWRLEQIFEAILPPDIESPTSYTNVGHILHLNLRDNQLPYKKIIGQIYLEHVPQIKTVVNKLNNIETEFRYFPMEILAGDDNTITTVKENNSSFTFDFAKVYWNSRLSTEHSNLLKLMDKGDVLYDVFAGVGPFTVPAGRKGIVVLANDLNPESFKWLQSNVVANKAKNVTCFNKDGREFLKADVKAHLLCRRRSNANGREHIAMNLPAIAHEFLDVFFNWMSDNEVMEIFNNPPLIHLYCFAKIAKTDDPKLFAQNLVETSLGSKLSAESLKMIHHVRNVAPNKEMMRVSFYLTKDLMTCGESTKMGKNKKISKTKNVFKVPMKGTTSKAKKQNKIVSTKKKNQNNSKTKSQDKIKAIDQQLVVLRKKVSSGDITNESEKISKYPSKTKPLIKSKPQVSINSDIMQQLTL